ncbi:carboxymuconolactone decarboxylase family protein [Pseudoalteromonas luteoviolacea]|uniref:carboxymuconolactone decarboxylase family protein n=1 Tax=Pseudoalteromonas luteoviolacea TaxID=43657 RepID=UPI001B38650C|nr:carboxymuconolactone decarboxylase family protein [Pseudoalteromonas luteoviolacea]MBQ4839717.1 carboxymuconolactone decarboxylase family protein [Pseudoalteromonas luteoviolacea]
MISRTQLYSNYPFIHTALAQLGEPAEQSLPEATVHLIRLYVSNINGCQFCQAMHDEALKTSASSKLYKRYKAALANEDLSSLEPFDQAALFLAHRVTSASSCELDKYLQHCVSESQQLAIIGLALQINNWNRVAIGLNL